jgi:hypothetical protein
MEHHQKGKGAVAIEVSVVRRSQYGEKYQIAPLPYLTSLPRHRRQSGGRD